MIETEYLEVVRDSVSSVIPLLREIVNNSNPVPYTVENLEWTKFNVFLSIMAVIVGALGSYYGYKGYYFSKLTAKNVERLPQSTQMKLCESFLLDLMTRFVRAASIIVYCDKDKKNPSDNYLAIFTLPDFTEVFAPEIFYDNGKAFILLNDIKARMKQYNHLIEIIEGHCAEENITERDKKTLIVRTAKLVRVMSCFLREAYNDDDSILLKLYREIVGITKKRNDQVDIDNESKERVRDIHAVMSNYFEYTKLNLSGFCMDDDIKEIFTNVSDTEVKSDDILLLLAYNGLLEYQYIS